MLQITPSQNVSPAWWSDNRHTLDLAPPYQRKGNIWKDAAQSLLIDSAINGFDIPKFYVADFTTRDSPLNLERLPFAVIDGKQRFLAFFRFFDNQLPLAKDFVLLDDPARDLRDLTYRELGDRHPDIPQRVSNYVLTVMNVVTDDEAFINQLFVRLNRGLPLVGAEIRNAMEGAFPEIIRELAAHPFFTTYISFQTNRGQDLNASAKLLLVEYSGELVDTKKRALDSLTDELVHAEAGAAKDVLEGVRRALARVSGNLEVMQRLFRPRDPLLGSPGLLTVYYWLVRELGPDEGRDLRQFLAGFEASRTANRRLMAELTDLDLVDRELLQFDLYNRNTNDQGSLRGRFEILLRRYREQARES